MIHYFYSFQGIFISNFLIRILILLFVQPRSFSLQDSFMRNKVGSIISHSLVDHMTHCICFEIFKCSVPREIVNSFIIVPNFMFNRCRVVNFEIEFCIYLLYDVDNLDIKKNGPLIPLQSLAGM